MTGQTPSSAVPDGFAPANFSRGFLDHAGPYFLKQVGGLTIIGVRMAAQHDNYIGVAHGGVLTTLADVALSLAVYQSEVPHLTPSTVSMTSHFLSAARIGEWIEASACIDRSGKRLAYVHGSICCGDRLIMTMSAVFNIIRPKIGG